MAAEAAGRRGLMRSACWWPDYSAQSDRQYLPRRSCCSASYSTSSATPAKPMSLKQLNFASYPLLQSALNGGAEANLTA